jgi:hypothetical protein
LQAIFLKVKKEQLKTLPGNAWNTPWLQTTARTTRLLETFTLNQEQEAIGIPIHQVRYDYNRWCRLSPDKGSHAKQLKKVM